MLPEEKVNSAYFMRIFNDIFVCDCEFSVPERLAEKKNHVNLRKAVYTALRKNYRTIEIAMCTTKRFAKYIVKQSKAAGFNVSYKLSEDQTEAHDDRQNFDFVFKW